MRTFILPIAMLTVAFCAHVTALAQSDYHSKVASYLNEHYSDLGLQRGDAQHFTITDNYVSKHNGVRHIHITQQVNELRVLNGTANLTLDAEGNVVHVANRLVPGLSPSVGSQPQLTPEQAIYAACEALGIERNEEVRLYQPLGHNEFIYTKGDISLENIPVEKIYWADAESNLHLAYSLSIYQLDAQHWWHAMVDAESGQLIEKIDWVVHCEASVCGTMPAHTHAVQPEMTASPALPKAVPNSYRVFEFPLESPNHGARTLAIDPADTTASPFGWHDWNGAAGADFTVTRGNNVNAYEDTLDNNSTGYQPDGGALLEFDFPLNLNNHPRTYIDAAVTNLFYVNNRIHDITYRYGFDEAGGNFQFNNYGKGGMGFDDVQAEAQDGGGTNNANFATPSDGSNPRMQMYLWTAGTGLPLTVNTPGSIAGVYQAVGAAFGPEVPVTPLTDDVVLVNDTTGPDPNDGCEIIQNGADLMGKIALVNRGSCLFVDKVQAAQNEGAIAVIVINNIPGSPIVMGGTSTTITIPSVMISQADGQLLINALGNGDTVNVTLQGLGASDHIDGDFDNGVVVHEYGHGISNRLTGGPSNASCLSNDEQMGEGWSDWFACMLTLDLTRPNPEHRPIGTFVRDNPPNGSGIRNEAYDTSFAVNDYTYGDVSNTALLSQPHGVGFVWATMLWDLTWAFMDQYGYDGDLENATGGDNIVMQLVMDGLKHQACSPGFVDGRDAILLADQLNNGGANQCLIWEVFARRGLGYSASQGSSLSRTDQTEAFDLPPICQTPVSAPSAQFVADTTVTCSGKIQFTDLSTAIPQQWHWDFGDGNTSADQNPAHTYTTPGTYTVKLVVSNTIGSDSLVRTAYIDFSPPEDPIIPAAIACTGESVVLSATASGTVNWLDASNNFLATGASFNTPVLIGNTTFHAVNEYGSSAQHVGPVDENFGTGGNHNTAFTGTVDFTADVPLTIRSAYVVAGSPGPRTVFLWDAHSAGGSIIDQVSINPSAGAQRVTLDFEVPGPGNYSIGLSNADLYRNNAGTNYPYTIPGVISIVGSSAGPDFYYYLYDLEVKQASCYSDTVAVTVTVLDSVDFAFQDTGLTVDFTDLSGAGSGWQWDFGDGNTSTDQHPTHTYTANGTYTVTLTVGPCSQTYEVTVTGVGINQLEMEGTTLTVQPNPATDATLLKVSQPLTRDVPFRLMSLDGRLVHTFTLPAGETQWTLDLSRLPASVYWLVTDGQPGAALQVVVLR